MKSTGIKFQTVDEYIGAFPEDVRDKLEKLRQTIRKAVPEADEVISYQMPTFRLHTNLVHFAAFKNHIGFYPTPSAIEAFSRELTPYEVSRGTVRFPMDQPLPFGLIKEMVRFRAMEDLEKEKEKKKKRKKII